MAKQHLEALNMADAQRKRATLDRLRTKKAREKVVEVELPLEGGGTEKVELIFRALGSHDYDALMTKYPPTSAQRKEGAAYNVDLFAPALLAAVCVDPQMTEDEARDLWNSGEWNRGELMTLFRQALDINVSGLQLDPTESVFA